MSVSIAANRRPFQIVVGGTSLGGLVALRQLLAGLPREFPWPVVFVQHRGEDLTDSLTPLLQVHSRLTVKEAEDKERILPGCCYLAPRGYHLLIEDDHFALSTDAPILAARPSIDVLFETAAEAYGPGVVGVVLTGASVDGARGAARIKRMGGQLVAQDPTTAECGVMPRAAILVGQIKCVLPVPEISEFLCDLCRETIR